MDRRIELLLSSLSPSDDSLTILQELGFLDAAVALKRLVGLLRLDPEGAAVPVLRHLFLGMSNVPYPDGVLLNFERFLQQVPDPRTTFHELSSRPRSIEILLRLFVGSQYLTETLLRSPEYLERLTQHRDLADLKSREEILESALAATQSAPDVPGKLDALRRYQRWEILRIGVCDNVGLMDLRASTSQLSLLADALIHACLLLVAGERDLPGQLLILGMGKLGGEELNYSSDIDLIFLSPEQPERQIPLAQRLIRALQATTAEGFLYRVDMRLRPWGRAGALVTSTTSFLEYLRRDAELWERQALLKARLIAGDEQAGLRVIQASAPLIYGGDPLALREGVRGSKNRIEAGLKKRGMEWGEVKSGTGSIRDIEFVTQYLQLVHGAALPQLRTPNTLDGLIRLTDQGLLQADEYRHLTGGYVFLRTIEHALQLMHNKQEHRLPTELRELNYLARRLDFSSGESFLAHYERHCQAIRRIYDRHLGDGATARAATPVVASPVELRFTDDEQALHRHLLQQTTHENPVRAHAELKEGPVWKVTVAGIDHPGDLSMICGLLFVYGFDILDGLVTTGWYPNVWGSEAKSRRRTGRSDRDFVDVFTVRPPHGSTEADVWIRYEADLRELFRLLRDGKDGEAQGRLANRVASALEEPSPQQIRLSPVDVQIDNDSHAEVTVLQIRADDTLGFLYELANALSLSTIDIQLVVIRSDGRRVFDTLHVTDARHGGKITEPARLQQLQAAVVLIKHFTHLLPSAPHPEAALLHFRGFVQQLFEQPNWWEEWTALDRPEVLDALARLLGVSDFLWEDVLRLQYANLVPLLRDQAALHVRKTRSAWVRELNELLQNAACQNLDPVDVLNTFKDREMFRTDMRHILWHIKEFGDFAEELTDLAEVVVEYAASIVQQELQARYGPPGTEEGELASLVIAALGKCGGRELGFASDIELLFIYAAEGETTGAERIPNASYFQRFVERFMQTIRARREGIFHVDLRLRPYGKAGPLAVSLPAFVQYYAPEGAAWPFERQALVKLRPIAGDPEFAARLIQVRDELIYTGTSLDLSALRAMREKQVRQLVRAGTFHAKLSPGGLVDVEYLVQALQLLHGHRLPSVRVPNTRQALEQLANSGVLAREDYERLVDAYVFQRRLIDALRMVRGDARDLTVPSSRSEEFEFLARRLGAGSDVSRVKSDLNRHTAVVAELVRRILPPVTGME